MIGVFGGFFDWGFMGIGVLVGIGVIVVDEIFIYIIKKFFFLFLVVGMGMYLLMILFLMILIGVVFGWLFDKWVVYIVGDVEGKKWIGILLVMGFIVGELIFGVIYVVMIVVVGFEDVIVIVFELWDSGVGIVGVIIFVVVIVFLYWWIKC